MRDGNQFGSGNGRKPGAGEEAGNVVAWRTRSGYSPVQDRSGIKPRSQLAFPPARERVTQSPDAFTTQFLDERETMRATYQGDDRCQLACPGCYTGKRLTITPAAAAREGIRKVVPHEEFVAHMQALTGIQDLYLLGAEPTMDPAGSAAKLAFARQQGWPQQTITHGAVSVDRFEDTFGDALESGTVYMLVVSLDSTTPQVHNTLRGRGYAHERTMNIIRHCVARNAPFKVQMTVWPRNYATICDSVRDLYEMGVRAFSFHCGSLEGVTDEQAAVDGLSCVDPLAWRALADQLLAFRDRHLSDLWHFNVPFLYFTEDELRAHVIGDDDLTGAYLDHVDAVEAGQASAKPVHACPALEVPQVYVYANDGAAGRGMVSLCNIHNPAGADGYADFNPGQGRWQVRSDPASNQMQHMIDSPHLCPALPMATRARSDRVLTEAGPLFHACRYIASNQIPVTAGGFGEDYYAAARDLYAAAAAALEAYPSPGEDGEYPVQRITRVTAGIPALRGRADALAADLAAYLSPAHSPAAPAAR